MLDRNFTTKSVLQVITEMTNHLFHPKKAKQNIKTIKNQIEFE